MTLKIKGIEQILNIVPGEAIELIIENKKQFYNISKRMLELDEDEVVLFDSKILNNSKYILVLTDLLNLNPNNKKTLISNYKNIENLTRNTEINNQIIDLNSKILSLLEEVSLNFNSSITYDNQITLSQLLEVYNFKYKYDDLNFIDMFVSYIKSICLFEKFKIVFTYNIQDFVENDEFDLLNKELGYLGITLINMTSKKSGLSYKNIVLIDKDLCEI